ncbi:hypothetical protein [Polycladidibacter hongkongensis]|uniref:hypothetical protein n=1 Tax=Polycladidibacter hongkongensis TaxID=1647556 RepID=UPI00082D8009|nr:hypothetical protein [Pseudovibrio hongkongensis]
MPKSIAPKPATLVRANSCFLECAATSLLALLFVFAVSLCAKATEPAQKPPSLAVSQGTATYELPGDALLVTLSPARDKADSDPLDSGFDLWVGKVSLPQRDAIWVELIDGYGEVVYESEVTANETHLLPDGRAIAVSAAPPRQGAKKNVQRLQDAQTVVVSQVPFPAEPQKLTLTLLQTSFHEQDKSTLLELARAGQSLLDVITTNTPPKPASKPERANIF